MLIEVIDGQCPVDEVRSKDTREIIALKQTVYCYIPNSAFPIQIKMRVSAPLSPGKYDAQFEFKAGRFGDLEINPFANPAVRPARPDQVKAAS